MSGKKRAVLFVEDDPDDVMLTMMSLEALLAPYEVVIARDGVEALDYLLARGAWAGRDPAELPALAIVDINLPRVSGVELLEELAELWGTGLRGMKVAMLSSSYIEKERERTLKLGASAHLRKPLSAAQAAVMVAEIRKLLPEAP